MPWDLKKVIPEASKGAESKVIFSYDNEEIFRADIEYEIGYLEGGEFVKAGYGNIAFVKNPGPKEFDFDTFITSLGGVTVVKNKIRNAAKAAVGA